jgi:hypothetical protein
LEGTLSTSPAPFIRPLTLGELLDQAIRLYRRNFLNFIGIIAIPYIPLTLIQTGLSYLSTSSVTSILENPNRGFSLPSGYWLGMIGMIAVAFAQFILVSGVATAAFTRAVADNYTGKLIGILDSYRNLGPSWLRLIGAMLIFLLIMIPLFIWTLVPCIGWLSGPGIFFFFALVVGPLIAPVIVLERHDILTSLRRAWDLGRTRFWWLLGFVFILSLLGQLIITGPTYLMTLLLQSIFTDQGNLQNLLLWRTVIQTLVQMIGGLLYLPLQLTAMTVVYFDLRVRSEGLDLALQAAAASGAETNIVALAETSPQPTGRPFTGTDMGQFILLSLAGGAIYFIFVAIIAGITLALMPGLLP